VKGLDFENSAGIPVVVRKMTLTSRVEPICRRDGENSSSDASSEGDIESDADNSSLVDYEENSSGKAQAHLFSNYSDAPEG